jgi:dipeptidyl aminopeptidase/acylaminoacyl peptidase
MTAVVVAPSDVGRPDLFISYAREDAAFVRKLDAALRAGGKDVWVDWEDIRPSADWRAKVRSGIESARVFVVVLSPELVVSEVCREELAHAVASNKRIVPVVRREIERAVAPAELTVPNWIFCRDGDDFEGFFGELVETLETDLDWLDEHARLLVRASEWEREGRDASFLLRGSDLRAAEDWLGRQGEHRQLPTALQGEYVVASRGAAGRRQRIILGGVLAGLAVALGLAVFAVLQRNDAVAQRDRAVSLVLASAARDQLTDRLDVSLLLGLEAYRTSPSAEAANSMIAALERARQSGAEMILRGSDSAFSPDGRTLATAGRDGTLVWDVRTRKRLGQPVRGQRPVAFSSNGRTLATAGDGTVRFWNVSTLEPLDQAIYIGALTGVAFSPDGLTFATAGDHGTLRLWDVNTGKLLGKPFRGTTDPVTGLAFSPDGRTLATANGDGTVRLWKVRTQQPLGQSLRGHAGPVDDLAFSPDGRTLATTGFDGTVRLWNVPTHLPLGPPITGHTGRPVRGVAFSPDGRTLATTGDDGTVRLWEGILWLDRDDLRDQVCHLVVGNLTKGEWAEYAPGLPYHTTCKS